MVLGEAETSGAGPDGAFIAVDWGSTHLRLRLLEAGRGGRVLAEHASSDGVGAVAAGGHEKVFLASLERLLRSAGRWEEASSAGGEVWFSGMVTSTLGWIPTPYVRAPAGPREVLAGLRRERLGAFRLHFLPGVRTETDMMRGEEVEAFGVFLGLPAAPEGRVLVHPGTHSKWIDWEDGRIRGFTTVPTGDLHAGLHRATLLSRTLPPEPAAVDGRLLDTFDRGVDLASAEGPLSSLFKVRALPVLSGMPPPQASALLSGILIAGEVLERKARGPIPPVLVSGAPRLRDLYLRALGRIGHPAEPVPDALSARGSAEGLRILRALA